jgi:hypothetical protein
LTFGELKALEPLEGGQEGGRPLLHARCDPGDAVIGFHGRWVEFKYASFGNLAGCGKTHSKPLGK